LTATTGSVHTGAVRQPNVSTERRVPSEDALRLAALPLLTYAWCLPTVAQRPVILASDGTDSLVYVTGQDRQVFAYRVDLDTGEVAAVTVKLIDC
jgi:hypothetical protein